MFYLFYFFISLIILIFFLFNFFILFLFFFYFFILFFLFVGEVLLECGANNDKIYRIVKGECWNTIMVEGEQRELTKLKVGEIFGELSILEQNSETQSIISSTNGELSVVSIEYLGKLFETENTLARRFYQFIATKLALKLSTFHKKKENNSPRVEKNNSTGNISSPLKRSRFFFIFLFFLFFLFFFIFFFIFFIFFFIF